MVRNEYCSQRNYQSKVRAFCIGLLNQYADIEVKLGTKKAYQTLPFVRVDSIYFSNEDIVRLQALVKIRVATLEAIDLRKNVKQKTALFRKKKNTMIESIHLLIDILREKGFEIESHFSQGRNETLKRETVISIRKGSLFWNKQMIEIIGERLCINLVQRIGGSTLVKVPKKDSQINLLLYS
ncbi:hypothetical protein EDI_332470 [Entamoeba dispar SAW760]|uniref:Uncharacterized protein n=1 Tax=Entamoeba dispar (strain ATCC PRA-260 / SAW760) TaxID=370354 RepID=B0E7C5_ENTDS|nr:uncharacterized protein EDI_332470 [Entamoeba dispar SAW760]EDR29573.1 hypothetical protein EDI_332470 [Entamoeba dispar SAW760]|eukprot:EDR29573.1 hypothetical protein EDI_332470 [Entamoeba dispar SAW760]